MASSDVDVYVRKDVYEADQRALISEIRLMHNELLKKIDDKFEGVNARFDRLERKVEVLTARVDNLNGRINDTHRFMFTGFALIGFIVAFVVFIQPLAKFLRNCFKPKFTPEQLEQIRELIKTVSLENRTSPLP